MEAFEKAFRDYVAFAGIKDDKLLCSMLSAILEQYQPGKQIELLESAAKHKLDIRSFVVKLGARVDVTKISAYLKDWVEKEARPAEEVKSEAGEKPASVTSKLPASKPAPNPVGQSVINAPGGSALQAPEGLVTTPISASGVARKPAVIVREEQEGFPTGILGADEDKGGVLAEETFVEEAPAGEQPKVATPPSPVSGSKLGGPRVMVPTAPLIKKQPVKEEYEFFDWFKDFRGTYAKWKKNREIDSSSESVRPVSAHRKGGSNNSSGGKTGSAFGMIGLVLLIVLLIGASLYTATTLGETGVVPESTEQAGVPTFPENTDPETVLKEFELNTVFDSAEPLLRKPTIDSILDGSILNNMPWNWLIWFLVLAAPILMLVQDRFAEHEETDLKMVIPGLLILLFLVFASYPISRLLNFKSVDSVSMEVFRLFFEKFLVLVGVLVNIAFQWSATMSGKKDYSALAFAGLFFSGAIVYWWYPDVTLAVVFGWLLMFAGIALQYVEIGVSGQGTKAVMVSLIMIAAFFFGFSVGLKIISDWSVDLYEISPILAFGLYKWRVIISALFVSTPIAIGIGFLAGMILLRIERSDGGATEDSVASIARLGEVVLYDAISFGVMLMYPLVGLLTKLSALSAALS